MKNFIAIIILVLISTFLAFGSASVEQKTAESPELISFTTEDGGLIYANLYGKGDRGVVLAHGGRFTKESWEKQAQALVKAGFRVLAVDFRGRGQSRGGAMTNPNDDGVRFDVLAAVRYLRRHDAKSVSVVGASFGGGAAAEASIEARPGEIDRLALLAHSPIDKPERIKGRKLFILTRDDFSGDNKIPRLPRIRDQYERAPEPKELVILDGSAHAQFIFETDQGERLMREILRFLSDDGNKSQNPDPISQSTPAALLQEFKNAKFSHQQAEVGEKLVALNDRSIAPAMVELLGSDNRAERCNAGRVLAALGDDRGLFAVIAELNDKTPRPNRNDCNSCKAPYSPGQIIQDRYYAAHVLRAIRDKRAVPALIETLQDEDINYQAAIVLGNLRDDRAVPSLLASLERARTVTQHPSSLNVRLWTGYALLGLRHPEGLPAVVEFLKPEHSEGLRRHAVDALGRFGGKDSVPYLIESLKDRDAEVRVNAAMALGQIGDKLAVSALRELLKNNDHAEGRARLRYELPAPLFKLITVHEAASKALQQIERNPRNQ